MKRAKRRHVKPRAPVPPLLKKGGAHQRQDKRASRARQKQRARREAERD
jgi:hypothetical protein